MPRQLNEDRETRLTELSAGGSRHRAAPLSFGFSQSLLQRRPAVLRPPEAMQREGQWALQAP